MSEYQGIKEDLIYIKKQLDSHKSDYSAILARLEVIATVLDRVVKDVEEQDIILDKLVRKDDLDRIERSTDRRIERVNKKIEETNSNLVLVNKKIEENSSWRFKFVGAVAVIAFIIPFLVSAVMKWMS